MSEAAPPERRVSVVTGASGGIGIEIARALLERGDRVVLAVRDEARGEAAAREIGGGEVLRLDLADLASVREFAGELVALHDRLDLLVNNAGIHTSRRRLTPQAHESTFATNHLGHFLLTNMLLGLLLRSAPARVVNVASEAHRFATAFDFDDVEGRLRWSGLKAYVQSKLANVMFTQALARRLEGSGVTVNAAHPGSVRTGWARGVESGLFRFGVALASPFLLSPAQGARTPLHVATAPELEGLSGRYFVRMREVRPSRAARDVGAQEKLWRVSEDACRAWL